jgi:hypothetical protein
MDPLDESPLDEPTEPALLDGSDVSGRLDTVEQRLRKLAGVDPHGHLTEPDPGGDERWEGAQVWAHIAEFVPYWHTQLETVIGEYDGTPVPFGRLRTDPGRLAAIEMGLHEDVDGLRIRAHQSIEDVKRYLDGLTPAELSAVGVHPTLGEMGVEHIVERFVVGHLEEHADQLDKLE